jgi:spore maturation protein A
MLNYIWFGMLVIGIVYGILNGRVSEINQAIVDSAGSAVKLAIGLLGAMCLWTGIMGIMEKSGILAVITRYVRPILTIVFPDLKRQGKALGAIMMNLLANFLGLGNAATPLGLKAMEELQRLNPDKDTATNSMCMFLVLNTAAVQLIPVTVIAIRSQAGSEQPAEITVAVWIASTCATIAGVLAVKLFSLSGRGRRPTRTIKQHNPGKALKVRIPAWKR